MNTRTDGKLFADSIGKVVEVNNPNGVSWVSCGSLALEGYEESTGSPIFDIVPVSTEELEDAKGEEINVNDYFKVSINVAAKSQAEVEPQYFEYEPPVSDEEFDGWIQR